MSRPWRGHSCLRRRDSSRRSVSSSVLPLAALLCLPAAAQHGAVNPAFFAATVYPILESAQCRGCHATDGVASGTRLHFPEKDASQAQIQLFGLSLAPLVDRSNSSQSLLLVKPTNRLRHTGGERVHPGSEEEKLLTQWVEYLASTPDDSLAAARRRLGESAAIPKPDQLVRRLTH